MRFGQPWALLLLALLPLVVMGLRALPRASAARREAAWACLALALAGPALVWGAAPEGVVLAVDLSASAARSLRQGVARLREIAGAMPGPGPLGVVAFGGKAHVVAPLGGPPGGGTHGVSGTLDRLAAGPEKVLPAPEREETDIAAALVLAASALPPGGGRVILATDGGETRGDARRAARDLAARGVAVDVVPLDPLPPGAADAAVEDVEAPARVPQGLPFEVRATVHSAAEGPAAVSLLRDGAIVERRALHLARGETRVRFAAAADAPGERRYGIRVALAGDAEPRNDAAEVPVMVAGRPRILWIGRDREAPRGLTGFEVTSARPEALADPLRRLAEFDAVVLAGVEAEALPPGAPERLRRYVGEQGGGLFMLGGAGSFAPGGYRGTPIEEALPVDLDPGIRRVRPGLALVVVLDKSGSMAEAMGGAPKIAAAREAVLAAAALLEPGDRFGLVAFDGAPARVMPAQEAPARGHLQAVLAGLRPGGGTRILPALAEAATLVHGLEGWRRHLVLVTDGQGEGGDFPGAARALAAKGVTVSTVAVGDDADAGLLRDLAAAGGGRAERARDAARLAAALRREVTLARGPVIHEGRTGVLATPHPALGDLAGRPVPPLFGYVATAPKPFAAVPLRAESGDPILALGGFGLGRAAALATDPAGPWGAAWRDWPGWPRLMAQALGWVLRAPDAGPFAVRQEPGARGGWALVVEAADAEGNHLNGRALRAHVRPEGGAQVEMVVPLEQRGPGRYAGPLPARVAGPALVVLEDRSAGEGRAVAQARIGLSYPEEYRLRGADRALLDDLRRISGGAALGEPGAAPALRRTRPRAIPLWPGLAVLGLALFLADLVLARGFRGRAPRRAAVPAAGVAPSRAAAG